jgi:hypothetical protein
MAFHARFVLGQPLAVDVCELFAEGGRARRALGAGADWGRGRGVGEVARGSRLSGDEPVIALLKSQRQQSRKGTPAASAQHGKGKVGLVGDPDRSVRRHCAGCRLAEGQGISLQTVQEIGRRQLRS